MRLDVILLFGKDIALLKTDGGNLQTLLVL